MLLYPNPELYQPGKGPLGLLPSASSGFCPGPALPLAGQGRPPG
jgi:hypothetical protein